MKGGIIVPNTFVGKINGKLLFLAGPIKLACNWHINAIEYILSLDRNINIVSPKRINKLGLDDKKNIITGDGNILNTNNQLVDCNGYFISQEKKGNSSFERQRAFELYYLQKASQEGCVMFWLPGQETYDNKKAYGGMTRFELGQIMTEKKYNPKNGLIIGTDGNFSEIKTIIYDIKQILGNGFPIYNNLYETCNAAINYLE